MKRKNLRLVDELAAAVARHARQREVSENHLMSTAIAYWIGRADREREAADLRRRITRLEARLFPPAR